MIRIGILGAARIAPRGIVTPANDLLGTEVVAVASRDLERARDFAAQHSIPLAFGSYAELIARDDIDLVYVAVAALGAPAVVHGCARQWQTRAGRETLRQQRAKTRRRWWPRRAPPTATSSKAFTIAFIRCSSARSRRCAAAPSAAFATSKRSFNANLPDKPGELRYIEELGGGALMDLGCYCMHWIRTVAGDEPTRGQRHRPLRTPGVDIEIEAELAFTSGPTATLKCSMQPEDGVLFRRLRVQGDKGLLEFDNPVSPHAGATLSMESEAPSAPQIVAGGETTFHYQLRHVLDVIAGRAQPLTGGDDAVSNMRAIDAIYRAAGLRPRGLGG